jgi:hypothetical protein
MYLKKMKYRKLFHGGITVQHMNKQQTKLRSESDCIVLEPTG